MAMESSISVVILLGPFVSFSSFFILYFSAMKIIEEMPSVS